MGIGRNERLGEMASWRNNNWAKWQMGKMAFGRNDIGQNGKKIGRNGIGRNGHEPFPGTVSIIPPCKA